jgi:phosphate transport system permease protein
VTTSGRPATAGRSVVRRGDRVFRGLSTGAGVLVLVIMAGIGIFLLVKAIPALRVNTVSFLTSSQWLPDSESGPKFGIAALTFGTAVSSIIAMCLAVPVGYGIALCLSHYAPRRPASVLAFIVDLLAAVPSIIFGLWGLAWLMPRTEDLWRWLDVHVGFIPLFDNTQGVYTRSIAIASVVLAIMILPTVSAISREVFSQAPAGHIEAAMALGATRWEMIRLAVIPFGKPGMISAAMLGLGRALGETIAVALLLSATFEINWHITEPGGNTFAANIALKFNEAADVGRGALIASGLVLFIITLAVNMIARLVVERRREFSGAN